MKAWTKAILKVGVSAALIAYLVKNIDLAEVWAVLRSSNWSILCFAFLLFYVGYAITAARWQTLLRALGKTSSYWFLVRSFMVAIFFNNFLPSTIGGDAMRMYDSWRSGSSKSQAIAAVLMDRFMGLTALLIFAVTALLVGDYDRQINESRLVIAVTLLASAAICALAVVVFMPSCLITRVSAFARRIPDQLGKPIESSVNALSNFRDHRFSLFTALILSFFLQANVILYHWIVAQALGLTVSLTAFFLIVPIAIVVMMVPISINGIGVREGLFVFLLSTQGVPHAQGLAYAWIIYALLLLQGLVGGVVFAVRKEKDRTDAPIPVSDGCRKDNKVGDD
jgi:uncharacterized protein (TIRG00374 family)